MAQSDNIAPLRTSMTASAEDVEIAKVLEQSRRDSAAGLSLRGDAARAHLQQVRDKARARMPRQTR